MSLPPDTRAEDKASLDTERQKQHAIFILALRQKGVHDPRLLAALERVPLSLFLTARQKPYAYKDWNFPIACGQTLCAPSSVGRMLQALALSPKHTVLEIGTGSGYQTAVLSQMTRRVFTIERYKLLYETALRRFEALKCENIHARCGDGLEGWPEKAPFERIILSGALSEIPGTLCDQLAHEGHLLLPFGKEGAPQELCLVTRQGTRFDEKRLTRVWFPFLTTDQDAQDASF